ncbi:MAG: hypothetical protein KDM91_20220 [Verrucomicrobiae bacterium]|nr:hypothetical protein [Verrucomicrobiae bacterium]MCP5540459.1 hypothetical protein [Akkermansiaceae bacterium]
MDWGKWLEKWGMSNLKLKTGFLEADFSPQTADRDAAWDLYVELVTRVTTQPVDPDHGDEAAALASVHRLFQLTRKTLRRHGPDCGAFARVAIVVLNQVIRPFTAKWHRRRLAGDFDRAEARADFRRELAALQNDLRRYMAMLADMARVEDLTDLTAGP